MRGRAIVRLLDHDTPCRRRSSLCRCSRRPLLLSQLRSLLTTTPSLSAQGSTLHPSTFPVLNHTISSMTPISSCSRDGVHPFIFDEHFSLLDGLKGQFPLEQIESGLNHVWNSHVKGYAGKFSREVVEMIRTLPEVDYIEQDQVVYALETQKSAPWVRLSPCSSGHLAVARLLTRFVDRASHVSAIATS